MKTLACISAILLSAHCLPATEEPGIDPDLPQPLDFNFAETLLTDSPFSRSVNLEESLQLTSVAYVDGRPVATVLNRATKERVLVFEEPNALGWRLVAVAAGTDLSNTAIEMMVGPEHITMHYNSQQVSPGTNVKEGKMSRLADGGPGKKAGTKISVSALLGKGGKQDYTSLPPDAQEKFKETVRSHAEQRPELTPEQNSAYAKKVLAKIKEAAPAASSRMKSPKSGKPPKKKQGA